MEQDKEDDDDVSLLAAPLVPETEEDVGDGRLLAVEMVPECGVKEEEEDDVDDESLLAAEKMAQIKEETEDYLEGMTAEMFGDDEEFDRRDDYIEDEEVEALPDEHYGLLGASRVLIHPQGCMDDLPEEVLRQVLSLLPAQDLCRNGSLVCHRWRNIIQDTKVKQAVLLSRTRAAFLYV